MSHFSSDGPEAPFPARPYSDVKFFGDVPVGTEHRGAPVPDSHREVPTFPSCGGRDRRDASGTGSLLVLAAIAVGVVVVVIAAVVRWAS